MAHHFKGVEYPSLLALFADHAEEGVTYNAFMARLKKGWELEDALKTSVRETVNRAYVVDGVTYKNLKQLAVAANIRYEAAVKRRDRGFSDYEIFHGRKKTVSVGGVTYRDVNDAYHKLSPKASVNTVVRRMQEGMTPEQAFELEEKPRVKTDYATVIDGRTFENLKHAYDYVKPSISFNTVRMRVYKGYTVEEALGLKPRGDGRRENKAKIVVDGVEYSLAEASARFGISQSTLRARLTCGASPEKAVGLVPIERGELVENRKLFKPKAARRPKTYEVNGVVYPSMSALAKAYSLPYHLVLNRINNGWSLEEALQPAYVKTEKVVVRGKTYRSAMNAFEEIGKVDFSTYQWRKGAGHKLEVCLGLEPLPVNKMQYQLNGKSYNGLEDVGKDYGLTVDQLENRMKKMSLEEAVTYVPVMGRYSRVIFRRKPDLARSPGTLYFVRMAFDMGVFYKIGITKDTVRSRFPMGRDMAVLLEVHGKLEDMYEFEQEIHKVFRDKASRAEESFDGRTETLLLNKEEVQEITEYIRNNAGRFTSR